MYNVQALVHEIHLKAMGSRSSNTGLSYKRRGIEEGWDVLAVNV